MQTILFLVFHNTLVWRKPLLELSIVNPGSQSVKFNCSICGQENMKGSFPAFLQRFVIPGSQTDPTSELKFMSCSAQAQRCS